MQKTIETASVARPQRIVFIDAIRAYAILMMLQGHFVDKMLATEFRDFSNPIFQTWYFFRGITAPIFFFSTGLVFMYLLLKDNRPLLENERVKKGLKRVLMLVALGYLLKWNVFMILAGRFYAWYYTVDVLQCIGLALLVMIASYAVHRLTNVSLRVLLASLGMLIFLFNPSFEAADWTALPNFFENYFSLKNGSTFTPIPWIGYTCFGGVLGVWINRHPQFSFTKAFPWILLVLGFILYIYSSHWLLSLYELMPWENFKAIANNNHLFHRLGHVLIAAALVVWITRWWTNMPALVTKIGSETLTIYAVHYIVLYGTWFGLGVAYFFEASLSPIPVAIGALLFVGSFINLIYYIEPVRAFL
ncbi:MAG: heparan-alpha-glucosaminide N-acetyltransferase domain-containing protein [Saprospiraceae bacterium]